ncbi:protein phosphatase 2C domain-containing protein [Micromonospora sp. NPDC018662]|uniref:protein phosphatase 2C domain-containing protein n=1 Tax=Micromonospora sp. NPDC018662 TaxID=3364238 RepID=UPI003795BA18
MTDDHVLREPAYREPDRRTDRGDDGVPYYRPERGPARAGSRPVQFSESDSPTPPRGGAHPDDGDPPARGSARPQAGTDQRPPRETEPYEPAGTPRPTRPQAEQRAVDRAGRRPPARSPHWQPAVLGTPTADFEPRPAEDQTYRPDTVADGWSTRDFTVRAASVRGYLHRHRGTPRQDDLAVAVHPPTGAVVFAVADGVSAARHSHLGAALVCRAAVREILADLAAGAPVDWQNVVQQAAWQLVEQTRTLLGLAEADPVAAEDEMASTLVAGMVLPDGPTVSLIQVGDTGAWVLRDSVYRSLLDGKMHTRDAVVSSAVTALPRTPRISPRSGQLGRDEVLLIGTDGFGDALGDGAGQVGRYFAGLLARPLPPLQFAYHVDFSRETYDDDRTLLAIWPRTGA